MKMPSSESKWVLLKKMVTDHLKDFDEKDLLILLDKAKKEVKREGETLI